MEKKEEIELEKLKHKKKAGIVLVEVFEASLLLFDDVPREEIIGYGLSEFAVSVAEYINKFVKNYKR